MNNKVAYKCLNDVYRSLYTHKHMNTHTTHTYIHTYIYTHTQRDIDIGREVDQQRAVLKLSFNCDDVLADRPIESSTTEADPFPRAVHVISTGSYEGALLLNKKTMFPLKE